MKSLFDWILSRNSIHASTPMASFGLLILRVGIGLMMAFSHGWGKLGRLGDDPIKFADPFGTGPAVALGLAVLAEFFCALLITVGLATRAAVIPLIITMLTAALIIHGDDPFGKKELALMYLTPLLTLLFTGPGRYSVDAFLVRKPGA